MIRSFADPETKLIWSGRRSRKLRMLNQARVLQDMRVPPGNRLGARKGQHSIRINDQWRICFEWQDGGPSNVEIVDYHE